MIPHSALIVNVILSALLDVGSYEDWVCATGLLGKIILALEVCATNTYICRVLDHCH